VQLRWPGHDLDGKDMTVQVIGDYFLLEAPRRWEPPRVQGAGRFPMHSVEVRFSGETTSSGIEIWAAPRSEWLDPWD